MKRLLFIFFALSCIGVVSTFCQNDSVGTNYAIEDTLNEDYGLFDNSDLQEISLRFDITTYKRKKPDTEYLDAVLTYYTSENDSVNKAIKVRSRGVFRRNYCDFPPLLLNFKMKDHITGEFNRIHKLKMVTQCKPGQEDYLLREYLAYKLYNVLTDNSFRVKLLRVSYNNTFKESKPVREFAFVIEPIEFLTERTNSIEVKSTNLGSGNIKPEIMDRMAIFNYMIGNTDWTVRGPHNVIILSQSHSERPDLGLAVPYDFDFSGLVNTNYSTPASHVDIKSVRDRFYLGPCRSEEDFSSALQEFKNKKEEFYKVINTFPYLSERSKKDITGYLNEFYRNFDKRNTIIYNLMSNCKRFFNPI
jgi:hypothetical protein